MSRNDSGIAVESQAGRATGEATLQSGGVGAAASIPARFAGRVRLVLDIDDGMDALELALRRAARPEELTEEAVRQLCHARGTPDYLMEWAVLREGFHVVSRELLIEHLVATARRRLAGSIHDEVEVDALATGGRIDRGGTLVGTYRGTVSVERDGLTVRCSLGAAMAPSLAIDGAQPVPATPRLLPARPGGRQQIPVSGSLAIDGSFVSRQRGQAPVQARVQWRVQGEAGVSCVGPWSPLAPPLEEIIGYIGSVALARFAEALPQHLAALAQTDRGPTLILIERLLRLGRVSQKSRVYLLYWQRLRDFLLWHVSTAGRR